MDQWWPWGGRFKAVSVDSPSSSDMSLAVVTLQESHVVRDSTWEFGDVTEAYRRLEAGHVRGKVVVNVSK